MSRDSRSTYYQSGSRVNPIDELVKRLAKHPDLRFTATATRVEIESPTPEGFAVCLHASASEYVVRHSGPHEQARWPRCGINRPRLQAAQLIADR